MPSSAAHRHGVPVAIAWARTTRPTLCQSSNSLALSLVAKWTPEPPDSNHHRLPRNSGVRHLRVYAGVSARSCPVKLSVTAARRGPSPMCVRAPHTGPSRHGSTPPPICAGSAAAASTSASTHDPDEDTASTRPYRSALVGDLLTPTTPAKHLRMQLKPRQRYWDQAAQGSPRQLRPLVSRIAEWFAGIGP